MNYNIKNSVHLRGYLGTDINLISHENGNKKALLILGKSIFSTNDKGEKIKKTEWHRLIAWDKTAELLAKTVKKGSEIEISGKLLSKNYKNKEGITKNITAILISEFKKIAKNN